MLPTRIARLAAIASSAVFVAAMSLPQAALADKPGAHYATIIITDKGFDAPVYTVGDAGGTGDSDKPSITVVNKGTKVHGIKAVPGSLDQGIEFGWTTDGQGSTLACWVDAPCDAGSQILDSGGIAPGGSFNFGVDPLALPTDYTFTSPTDCLFGNSTPGFSCTPSRLHVSDSEKGLGDLSHSIKGTWVFPVGDPMCRTDVAAVTPSIGPAFCYGKYGVPGRVVGSSKKPAGHNYTVRITDFGYDPAVVYVEAPATVTWVNNGERVHSVHGGGGKGRGPDNFNIFDSPGIGPGESWSYTFTKFTADDPAAMSTSYSSTVGLDLLPTRFGLTKVNSADNAQPHCSTKFDKKTKLAIFQVSCGTSLMSGQVKVVDPNAPDWYTGPGSSTPTMQSYGNS